MITAWETHAGIERGGDLTLALAHAPRPLRQVNVPRMLAHHAFLLQPHLRELSESFQNLPVAVT